jgi:ABC-type transporter Mla MlaB component
MLRITIHENATAQTILLEGKIVGPWVEEFSRTWHSLAPSLGSKELHLDLRGVGFVDSKGRQLLREIYRKTNASFLADSPLTQYYAEDAMQQSPRNGEKGV